MQKGPNCFILYQLEPFCFHPINMRFCAYTDGQKQSYNALPIIVSSQVGGAHCEIIIILWILTLADCAKHLNLSWKCLRIVYVFFSWNYNCSFWGVGSPYPISLKILQFSPNVEVTRQYVKL